MSLGFITKALRGRETEGFSSWELAPKGEVT